MTQLILFNKPFQVITQFSPSGDKTTLAHFFSDERYKGYYPAGRLDYDSEGLLLLTNNGALQHQIAHPSKKMTKTYWVQVEGTPSDQDLAPLRTGVELKDGKTAPAKIKLIDEPKLWERHPPIRERKHQTTQWLEIVISEGRNRQVRRMTAAVGFPTLRLVRAAIGPWRLDKLLPGEFRALDIHLPKTQANKITPSKGRSKPRHKATRPLNSRSAKPAK